MSTRELNPAISSLTDHMARGAAVDTGLCSDGKKCGVPPNVGDDAYCVECPNRPSGNDQSSGGDNDYWVASIDNPKRLAPYQAECEDLIEHFQMTFAEGDAFKALWRKGMDRVAKGKPGDTPLRNAEKVAYYGARMVAMEKAKGADQ